MSGLHGSCRSRRSKLPFRSRPLAEIRWLATTRGVSYEGVNYEPLYRSGYYAAIAVAVAMILIFRPTPKPPPPNSKAYGCYTADFAPAIRLDKSGMNILQQGFPPFAFHLERQKTAITLTADAPIQADWSGKKYVYSMYHPGEGWYLDFEHIVDGKRYGEFDEARLSMFAMLARNGVDIVYSKAAPPKCAHR